MFKFPGNTLVAVLLLLCASSVNAATIWQNTNEDVDIIVFGLVDLGPGGTIALFEDTDDGTFINPVNIGGAGGWFEFTPGAGNSWEVEGFVGTTSQGTLTMDGNEFVLAVTWDSGTNYYADIGAGQSPVNPDNYLINFSVDACTNDPKFCSVVAIDLAPIPLPAAAWLFGSALIGLVAIKRRRV